MERPCARCASVFYDLRDVERKKLESLVGDVRPRPLMDLSIDSFHANPDWARLTKRVSYMGTGSRDVFGEGHHVIGGMYLQQDVYEISALVMALREKKRVSGEDFRYLEIGSASGGTAKLLHEEVGFSQMASIGLQCELAELKRQRFAEFPIEWTETDSMTYEALRWIVDKKLGPFDVVFIDGDHHRTGATRDIMMYRAFCKPGAWMAFHDTVANTPSFGVRIALDLAYEVGVLRKLMQYVGPANLGIEIAEVVAR